MFKGRKGEKGACERKDKRFADGRKTKSKNKRNGRREGESEIEIVKQKMNAKEEESTYSEE
jgi:hypothetical protein